MRMTKLGGALLAAVFAVLAAVTAAPAQDAAANYPNKPIRVIVPFAAGGGNDIFARLVGQKLGEFLGQTVIIENKPGAGGRLAAEYVDEPAARRLHAVRRRERRDVGRGRGLSEPVLSSDQELHSAVDDRGLPADPGDAAGPSGQEREGAGRVGEGQSRQGELRVDVAGLHHRDRAAQAQERHAGQIDPLQEQQRDDPQRRCRARPCWRSPTGRRPCRRSRAAR